MIDYVRCSARLLELALTDPQVERVALHLLRTSALAAALREVPLAPHEELVEIFCPAPFPAEDTPP